MRVLASLILIAMVSACAQSTMVFDPVNNKASSASTAATQGTLTVNVNFPSDAAHASQPFAILLYQNGTLKAGFASGSAATNASGAASLPLYAPDVSNCLGGPTVATLPNGIYQIYFTIRSSGDTATMAASGCGGNGFYQYSSLSTTFMTHRGTVTINGDTTYSITNTNTVAGSNHNFIISTSATYASWFFRCYVVDAGVTTITATTQPIALYGGTLNGSGAGCTTGNGVSTSIVSGVCTPTGGALTYRPPPGSYRYFCYISADSVSYLDSGVGNDRVASGTMTIDTGMVTSLGTGDFANF